MYIFKIKIYDFGEKFVGELCVILWCLQYINYAESKGRRMDGR
jgi:hypothetical protein